MPISNRLSVFSFVVFINLLNTQTANPMSWLFGGSQQKPAQQAQSVDPAVQAAVADALRVLKGNVEYVDHSAERALGKVNNFLALAHHANDTSIRAFGIATDAQNVVESLKHKFDDLGTEVHEWGPKYEKLSAKFKSDFEGAVLQAEKTIEKVLMRGEQASLVDQINVEKAKIEFKQRHGIYTQLSQIKAQSQIDAAVGAENAKWKNIKEFLGDSVLITKLAVAVVVVAFCIYMIKYGIPQCMNYLIKPRVVSETSLQFGFKKVQKTEIDELIFPTALQKQLADLLTQIQTAKFYDEALPNVIFWGAPGTGKTAFAKKLAYESCLDYVLTSGSEFAKITDLNDAINELRKLFKLANRSKNGVIIFIDEAESLFASKHLATTPKITQDFINTFLALVSEQAQKKIMFIFATNDPTKMDEAILNRSAMNIEFALPVAEERDRILFSYLVKFAQCNERVSVGLHPDLFATLTKYSESLDGFSPRAIKFIAEEMVAKACRQNDLQVTTDIAKEVVDQAKQSMNSVKKWNKDCLLLGGAQK